MSLFYQLQGLKLTLCAAQVEANIILGMYLISPPCVFQGSFVIEKRGEKRCWKKYTHAYFLQLIRSNRVFFLKRRHKAKCSGAASKEYKVQQNPFLSWFCLEQRNTSVHHT